MMRMTRNTKKLSVVIVMVCLLWGMKVQRCGAAAEYLLSQGQTVYVSVYSNIFSDGWDWRRQAAIEAQYNLTAILVIRNTDMHNALKVVTADYYDTKGHRLREYYKKPVVLKPLESTYIFISEKDTAGGFGANFLVTWEAEKEINAPIIESIMVGMASSQGISFVSPGRVIKEDTK